MVLLQAPGEVSESAALTEGIRPEALDERQIEDLIAEHLQQHLEILPEQDLANALHEFVDKVLSLRPVNSLPGKNLANALHGLLTRVPVCRVDILPEQHQANAPCESGDLLMWSNYWDETCPFCWAE